VADLFILYCLIISVRMSDISYFTIEGLEKLKAEIHDLKTRGRQDMAKQIAEAREKGDLSENAEYDAAKEAQGLLELRISKLDEMLVNARLIDESSLDVTKVLIFSTVRLKNLVKNSELSYKIVSEKEADISSGRISVESPIGKGLLGKSVGDKVEIKVPAGTMTFEIMEISRL